MNQAQNTATPVGRYRWVVVALLFFATTINYLDRQVIGLLKPTLEKEFSWTETDYSNIVIAFAASSNGGLANAARARRARRRLCRKYI